MNGFINILFADKIVRLTILISLVLLIIILAYIGLYYRFLPPVMPLYNQMPWGEGRLGTTIELFLLPLFAAIILLCNSVFARFIYQKMPLVARALSVTSLLIAIITVIFIFRTIQLVV